MGVSDCEGVAPAAQGVQEGQGCIAVEGMMAESVPALPAARSRTVRMAAERNAWERWLPRWHLAFAAIFAVATVSALLDPNQNWIQRGVSLGLALGLAGWYWALIVARPSSIRQTGPILLYLTGATVLFSGLTMVHPAFMLLSFCLYWQVYAFLRFHLAIAAAAVLTVVVLWRTATLTGQTIEMSGDLLLIGVVSLTVGTLFAWYVETIVGQSIGRQRLIDELRATQAELAMAERQTGVLRERQRLAREIHDTLAQGFISIITHLEAAEPALPLDAETARRQLDQARRSAREGLTEARRLVRALRPEMLEHGSLADAVTRVTTRWSDLNDIAAAAIVTGVPRPLPTEVEITLLRATQEALANVARHAAARQVTVTLSYMNDQIALDVQDDGVGFDPATVGSGEGFGLVAMGDRAAELGGALTIESDATQGTTVTLTLPAVPEQIGESELEAPPGDRQTLPRLKGNGDG